MRDKINQFYNDIKYFNNLGINFRTVLEIVCYKSNQENPINKWLLKLDSQVQEDGTLLLDWQDAFILNGLADEIGEKLVGKLIGNKIKLPNPTTTINIYKRLDKKYIDMVVYILSSDIMLLITEEILKDKN